MTKRLPQLATFLVIFLVTSFTSKAFTHYTYNRSNITKPVDAFSHNLTSATPVITESGAPSALTTVYGTASSSTSFTVSGSNMQAGIVVTPPAGFEVSTNNVNFSSTLTVGSAGNIANTTVYIRLSATASAANYAGNIDLSSTGAANVSVAMPNSSVNKASITVTAKDATKLYGANLSATPGSTAFTASGLQNGETIGSVTIGYGTGSQPTDAVATYSSCVTIANATGGTFSVNNYNINYVAANLIVNPAPLSVIANNVSKNYGAVLAGSNNSTAFTTAGMQNGETIGSVAIAYGTGAASTDPAGTYIDCVSIAAAAGGSFTAHNYNITYVPGNILVVPATLSVTANDITTVYGAPLTNGPGNTAFTSAGLQNGESIGSVSVTYNSSGPGGSHVGTCTGCIVPSNATGGTFLSSNYNINYIAGNYVVEPAPLTITADNKAKLYGTTNPALTASYTGLASGDTPASLTTQPTLTTTATTTSPVGSYPITVSGASSPDYVITYVDGTLEIDPFSVPGGFTPNGDGINDTWQISFLTGFQHCVVSVFNRFGQNVFYSTGYGTSWDGTYRGALLPTGVYYYVIDLKDGTKAFGGTVTIIK